MSCRRITTREDEPSKVAVEGEGAAARVANPVPIDDEEKIHGQRIRRIDLGGRVNTDR